MAVTQKNKPKIKTYADLRVVKEAKRYEVKLREQALIAGVKNFKAGFKESASTTFRNYTEKLLIMVMYKIIQSTKKK